ncbi:restriction endonuclease [Haloimpatiens sp. FM7315]|uniref:restriction endonuclease n=1 Tax=Haloimpatiens sp. FM7315 TaxID=3298609 RepID=UPI0039775D6E
MGVTIESFKSGRDKGIDLRYANDPNNLFIVQCKHYRCLSSMLSHEIFCSKFSSISL